MRRGPKGATVERKQDITETTTWSFGKEFILARLGLPPDTKLFVRVPGGADWSNMDLVIGDDVPLTAVATEVRKPKATP